MRIAICDDEKEVQEILADKVRRLCPNAELLLYDSGDELLLADRQPDVVFLDIQMPGRNGMNTAQELRRRNQRLILIFVTAIREYVFQAFDVGAFHYLVKPFTDEKFASVLEKAIRQYQEQRLNSSRTADQKHGERYFIVKSGASHVKVLLNDIIYAEVFNRKVMIHKLDEDIEYYGKLSDLQKQAGEDFFRTHRAYLVHLKYVSKYDATTVWLEKGKALMAKRNYPEFVKQYMKYTLKEIHL